MAWVKSKRILPEFKEAYQRRDWTTCTNLLGKLHKDDIPYFSNALASGIVTDLRQGNLYHKLYDVVSECRTKVRKTFASHILTYFQIVMRERITGEDSKPFQEVKNAVYDIVIPLTLDFMDRDIGILNSFCSLLTNYQKLGIYSDEELEKYREMMKAPEMRVIEQELKAPIPSINPKKIVEGIEFVDKANELKKLLENKS